MMVDKVSAGKNIKLNTGLSIGLIAVQRVSSEIAVGKIQQYTRNTLGSTTW